jgi:hypothetical protein
MAAMRIRLMAQGLTAAKVTLWLPDNQAFGGYQEEISSGMPISGRKAQIL